MRRHQEAFGGLDVLVNCGGVGSASPIEMLTAKQIDLQFGVNVRGLLLVTREAVALLRKSRGWIINIASIGGVSATPNLVVCGATKSAVISATRSLNAELEADGVRAVAICPGFVDAPMATWTGLSSSDSARRRCGGFAHVSPLELEGARP
jgi:NAD(P)-dependent dehydrogenase (short-subunit alcohol dehydrogenase family)